MRPVLLITLFLGSLFGGPSAPQQAKEKFDGQKFAEAAKLYESAIDKYPRQRATLEYNIAQSWLMQDSAGPAIAWYGRAAASKLQPYPASYAWNNTGVLLASMQPNQGPAPAGGNSGQAGDPLQQQIDQLQRALEALKSSMRLLPENDIARYNYELLKRRQDKLKDQQQNQQQNQDQQQEQEQEKEEQESDKNKQENKPRPKNNTEKKGQSDEEQMEAEEMGMEQAKMLLEAMKENEKKFLQQLEKSKKHKANRQDGPDW